MFGMMDQSKPVTLESLMKLLEEQPQTGAQGPQTTQPAQGQPASAPQSVMGMFGAPQPKGQTLMGLLGGGGGKGGAK